jgi:hypothetical protein
MIDPSVKRRGRSCFFELGEAIAPGDRASRSPITDDRLKPGHASQGVNAIRGYSWLFVAIRGYSCYSCDLGTVCERGV